MRLTKRLITCKNVQYHFFFFERFKISEGVLWSHLMWSLKYKAVYSTKRFEGGGLKWSFLFEMKLGVND